MDLKELSQLVAEYKYDEIKIIGKTIQIDDLYYHLAALMRKENKAYLCILSQSQSWEEYVDELIGKKSNRQSLLEQPRYEKPSLRTLCVDGFEMQAESISGGSLKMDIVAQLLMVQLLERGWQVPVQGGIDTADWDSIEIQTVCFSNSLEQLPHLSNAQLVGHWQHGSRTCLIQEPCTLAITDVKAGISGEQKLPFTVTDLQGIVHEQVCYINQVALFDPWETEEKRFSDPQYQKRMLEHVSQQQLEEIKQDVFQTLAKTCPRGMCYPVVEYECTMEETSLLFYDYEYLDGGIQIAEVGDHENGASFSTVLWMHKPEKQLGIHGIKLRSCMLQTLVPLGTKEICAELFSAMQLLPEQRVLICR